MKEFWSADRTIYPSVFRILIGLVLLVDLISTVPSAGILFNSGLNSLLSESGLIKFLAANSSVFFSVYGLILIAFILGFGRNFTAFLVFCFHFFMMELTQPLLTWGDIILKFSLLYFAFADSFRYLSLQKTKGKYHYVSKLAVCSILLHIFLVYLNNAYFKMTDKDWQQGIAVFFSFSQYPSFESSIWYPLISNEYLSKSINYFIILQQLSFVPFVIWKKTRYFAILLSLIIHFTMMYEFGLWKFEIIVMLHYGFLLNDKEWMRIIPAKIGANWFSLSKSK